MQVLSRQPHYYLYINILLDLLMNGRALSILDEDIPRLSVAHYVYDRQPDSSNNGQFEDMLILSIISCK